MLHPSTKKLIDRLADMTVQKKIDWMSGDQADTLVFDTEGYRVLLQGDPATLRLTDALGRELESASPDELAATPHDGGGTYGATMATMRREALRIARGTEGAISAVLGGLAGEAAEDEPPVFETEALAPSDDEMAEPGPDMAEDMADETNALSGEPFDEPDMAEEQDEPETASEPTELATSWETEDTASEADIPDSHDDEQDVSRAVETLARHVNGQDPSYELDGDIIEDSDDEDLDAPSITVGETDRMPVASPPADPVAAEKQEPSMPQQPEAPAPDPAPAIHSGFGGIGGFSDLSRYRSASPPAPQPEPAIEDENDDTAPLSPLPASAHHQSSASSEVLSLSGLSGFGLNPVEKDKSEPEAESTVSWADETDEDEAEAAPEEVVADTPEPLAAEPVPEDAAPPAAATEQPEKPDEPAPKSPPKPASSRFNPWM